MGTQSYTRDQDGISLQSFEGDSVLRSRKQGVAPDNDVKVVTEAMYTSENNPENIPDGGLEAYLVVFGAFVGLIADFGIANSMGAIQSYVSTHQLQGVKETSVSWIFSLHLGVMYFCGVFFGAVFDMYGARIPLTAGGICIFLGLMFTAECKSVGQFVCAFGILTAIGTSLAMQPLIGVISHWFFKKRGLACSLATIGGLVGSSCFAIMLQSLYGKVGFKWAIRILAFLCLFCMMVSVILVKERSSSEEPRTVIENSHQEEESRRSSTEEQVGIVEQYYSESIAHEGKHDKRTQFINFFRQAMDFSVCKDWRFVLLTISVAISELISMSTLTYLSSFAIQHNVSERSAYLLITIINATGIPSRLISGLFADKFGRFNVMIVTSLLVTISIFGIWLPAGGNVGALFGFGVLFGISTSAVIALIPVCCGQICSAENFGKVYGTMYFFLSFITLVGIYVASLVIGDGESQNYINLVYYEGALAVASLITWTLARYSAVGWKWCKF
ncbi:probable transporter Mch4p [[Candida] anglica]|uniref:Probable transporter Mch4p n=1 Tax=[Candida] anglica TaxID=148631 RepID=A0ABP0EH27_9ASCO